MTISRRRGSPCAEGPTQFPAIEGAASRRGPRTGEERVFAVSLTLIGVHLLHVTLTQEGSGAVASAEKALLAVALTSTARDFARRRAGAGGRIFVVHAYRLPAELLGFPNYDRLLEERQRHGRAVLAEVAPDDPRLETELIGGSPAEVITEITRVRGADEIVVGARGLSRARALLGSVSTELLHLADRPVVVIPTAAIEPGHMLEASA